ncbi:hypothetical protein ACH5RR_029035 [Cinchona calisaya]|uniref:Glabrous enhancer-binding protein-like DBD domain-containing protein n=1 Tax=Cinchona calisaya TaxID=153742 RepID=A0ABD2YTZ5_9GENT
MAPKKKDDLSDHHPPAPPPPESEEEESEEEKSESGEEEEVAEEEEEEEEEGSDEEEEEEEGKPKTPQIEQQSQLNKNPTSVGKQSTPPPPSKSKSISESEDEEEPDGEKSPQSPSASDFVLKPITPTKPSSKDSKPTSKRPQKDEEKDSRIKKKPKVNEEGVKKEKSLAVLASGGGGGGAGRVWSDEDVIKILQGMIDYQEEKGSDPSADMAAFHDFVKGKFQSDFSKTQIYEKVRRLKKKYFDNVEKSEQGEDPVFSKPHECKAFDLSKRIWGGTNDGGDGGVIGNGVDENVNGKSNNGKAKKSGKVGSFIDTGKEDKKKDVVKELVKDQEADFGSKYPFLTGSFDSEGSIFAGDMSFLKENLTLIGAAKAMELESKWKKLRQAEAEFSLERLKLMTEQTKLVLEGLK